MHSSTINIQLIHTLYISSAVLILCVLISPSNGDSTTQPEIISDLVSLKSGKQGLWLEGKLRVKNATKSLTVPVRDYSSWAIDTPEWLVEYSLADKIYHRIFAARTFNHSIVYSSVADSAVLYTRLVRTRIMQANRLMQRYPYRARLINDRVMKLRSRFLSSKCGAKELPKKSQSDFRSILDNFPNVSISTISGILPLSFYMLHVLPQHPEWKVENKTVAAKPSTVFTCNNCELGSGDKVSVDLKFVFPLGEPTGLTDLTGVMFKIQNRASLDYLVTAEIIDPDTVLNSGEMQPHEGAHCDFKNTTGLAESLERNPKWPGAFSLSTEHVDYNKRQVSYTDEYYSLDDKLARIDIRGSKMDVIDRKLLPKGSETFSNHTSFVLDYVAKVAFAYDSSTEKCLKIPLQHLAYFGKKFSDDEATAVSTMTHLLELLDFEKKMSYRGVCKDAHGIAGHLYHSRAALGMDMCFADHPSNWDFGAPTSSQGPTLLPLYMSKYMLNPKSKNAIEIDLAERSNFFDVTFRKPLYDVFDVSRCFNSVSTTYFILMASKTSNYSHTEAPEHEVCQGANVTNNDGVTECILQGEESGVTGVYRHAVARQIAATLTLLPSRIVKVAVSHRTIPGVSVIAFAVLDYAGISSLGAVNKMPQMRANNVLMNDPNMKEGSTLNVSYTAMDQSETPKQIWIQDTYTVVKWKAVSRETYEYFTKNKRKSTNSHMLIIMVVFAITGVIVGAFLGVMLSYKLWHSATSFGYMIHSDIS